MFRSKAGEMRSDQDKDCENDDSVNPTNFLHNSHWIKNPQNSGPSRYLGYYDAASLYPSSSKQNFFIE